MLRGAGALREGVSAEIWSDYSAESSSTPLMYRGPKFPREVSFQQANNSLSRVLVRLVRPIFV